MHLDSEVERAERAWLVGPRQFTNRPACMSRVLEAFEALLFLAPLRVHDRDPCGLRAIFALTGGVLVLQYHIIL